MTTKNGFSIASSNNSARSTTRSLLWVIAAVFLLALGARVAYLAVNGIVRPPDSVDYIRLAENVRTQGVFSLDVGEPLIPSIRRAPFYPVFLMTFIWSEGVSTKAAVATQVILDAGVAVLVLLLANMALNLRWAATAGLAYAIHPGAIYFSTALLSETLFTALSATGLFLVLKGLFRDRLALTGLAGATFGLATLCRPIALPFAFIIAGISVLILRIPRRWLHSLVLIGFTTLIVLPWTIRCTRVAEHLVLVQGASSTLFYVATRTDWNQKDQQSLWARYSTEDPYGRRLVTAKTPREMAEADQFGLQLALQNIRSNPKAYVLSRARNFPFLFVTSFDMFTGLNKSFGAAYQEKDWLTLIIKGCLLLVFSLAPLLLGLVGLLGNWRNPAVALPAVVWVYTGLAYLPMWIEYRYWVSAIPFLLVSAAVGAHILFAKFRRMKAIDRMNAP